VQQEQYTETQSNEQNHSTTNWYMRSSTQARHSRYTWSKNIPRQQKRCT